MPLPSRSTRIGGLTPRQDTTYPINITVVAPPSQGNITYNANLTHPYNESDLTSSNVTVTETVVVGGAGASATSTVVLHIGNSTSDSGSGTKPQPAVPALGAVLGVVVVIGVILIGLLLRKNKQLFRAAKEARESSLSDPSESNYPLANKELDVISQDDSPTQLKRQLAKVRKELAAVTVLAPSTIRDQSDYIRDLTLINDNIAQLSMRINSARPDVPAAAIRTHLCAALWSGVFARFDAGLDGNTEQQLSMIMSQFKKPSTALLWKAMTVQNLPLASPVAIAPLVEQHLSAAIGGGVPPGVTVEVVEQSLSLSRAVNEDGKGFSISYVREAQGFGLLSGSSTVSM